MNAQKPCQHNLELGPGGRRKVSRLASTGVLLVFLVIHSFIPTSAYAEIKASWYSTQSLIEEGTYNGTKTFKGTKGVMANGQRFNDLDFTCATRLYPLGTMLRITNPKSNKTVIVKVTDRISRRFARTRIDLSKGAFSQIADLKQGVVLITVMEI